MWKILTRTMASGYTDMQIIYQHYRLTWYNHHLLFFELIQNLVCVLNASAQLHPGEHASLRLLPFCQPLQVLLYKWQDCSTQQSQTTDNSLRMSVQLTASGCCYSHRSPWRRNLTSLVSSTICTIKSCLCTQEFAAAATLQALADAPLQCNLLLSSSSHTCTIPHWSMFLQLLTCHYCASAEPWKQ